MRDSMVAEIRTLTTAKTKANQMGFGIKCLHRFSVYFTKIVFIPIISCVCLRLKLLDFCLIRNNRKTTAKPTTTKKINSFVMCVLLYPSDCCTTIRMDIKAQFFFCILLTFMCGVFFFSYRFNSTRFVSFEILLNFHCLCQNENKKKIPKN